MTYGFDITYARGFQIEVKRLVGILAHPLFHQRGLPAPPDPGHDGNIPVRNRPQPRQTRQATIYRDIPRDLPLRCQLPDVIPVGTRGNTIHRNGNILELNNPFPVTSRKLLAAIGSGPGATRWTEFFHKYTPGLRDYATRHFPSLEADDLVQDTFK